MDKLRKAKIGEKLKKRENESKSLQKKKWMNEQDLLFEYVFGFIDATIHTTLSNFQSMYICMFVFLGRWTLCFYSFARDHVHTNIYIWVPNIIGYNLNLNFIWFYNTSQMWHLVWGIHHCHARIPNLLYSHQIKTCTPNYNTAVLTSNANYIYYRSMLVIYIWHKPELLFYIHSKIFFFLDSYSNKY